MRRRILDVLGLWIVQLVLVTTVLALEETQQPLSVSSTTTTATTRAISAPLFATLERLARLVDITYCVGTTGVSRPFECVSRCNEFPTLSLVTTWNTGVLMSDSCGYIAVDHGPRHHSAIENETPSAEEGPAIIVAFRGTYSITNTVVDLSTVPQEYIPYPAPHHGGGEPEKPEHRCTNCTVHMGFLESWESARQILLPQLKVLRGTYPTYPIQLVGHSLGGAVACLAALELRVSLGWENVQVATFGEPRVGNSGLARFINDVFQLENNTHLEEKAYRRVTHKSDPVPLLPLDEWGYKSHAGEIYISKQDLSPSEDDVITCVGDNDPDCIAGGDDSVWGDVFGNLKSADMREMTEESMEAESLSSSRLELWQLFFAHRDYFWRLGLCVPGGDPANWGREKFVRNKMDWDERVNLDNNVSFLSWIAKYDEARERRLTDWVSTFHPDGLPCKLTGQKKDDKRGAYNMCCKVEFENGEKWVARFPMVGKVINADEKVEIEVATMRLVRQKTTIPIPEVRAWGLAADNPLGIGPFIMMDFVDGDVSQTALEVIFRQTINFSLQLRKLDFAHIGSLTSNSPPAVGGFAANILSRPMTQKAQDYLEEGGVNVLGPQDEVFASTTEYFHHVVDRDLQHLHSQPNSVDDEHDARQKYIYFNIMKALIPRHVMPGSNKGPFKLMCDDFQPTNMIVNNEQDLKVIAVLDWEWSYTAPAQLVDSTPTWLLIESPHVWASVDDRLARFNAHLELYTRLLEEEELKMLGEDIAQDQKPSTALRASQEDGRQWFHLLILRGFNGPTCVPFVKLREATSDWDELAAAISEEDINSFVQKKKAGLQMYEEQLVDMKYEYKLALNGSLDLDKFLRKNAEILALDKSRYQWQSWSCFNL
ncbi:hypothetical protein G7046_g9317 [Stylonectria norvegica]|nr:hypothetical protein G7046_g9317 [Stylonectria norvegica]